MDAQMKSVCRRAAAGLLLALCGCAAPSQEQERFERIAASLDRNGSAYFLGSSACLGENIRRIRINTERQLWDSPLPPENRLRMQRFISQAELICRTAGFSEVEGWGGSSLRIAPELFRNRLRLLLRPSPRGALWQLPAAENIPLRPFFDDLPGDTFFAGVFNVNACALEQLLAAEPRARDASEKLGKMLLGLPVKEILSSLSGVWKLVIVCDEEYNSANLAGVYIALSIPDREGKLFAAMSSRMKLLSGARVDDRNGLIQLTPIPGKLCTPRIRRGKACFTIFSGAAAEQRTRRHDGGPLLLKSMPALPDDRGVFAAYHRNSLSGLNLLSPAELEPKRPSFGVLKRLPDGFCSDEIAGCDLNSCVLASFASFPTKLMFDIFSAPSPRRTPSLKRPRPAARGAKSPASAPANGSRNEEKNGCLKNIAHLGAVILKEGGKGAFPRPGIEGLRALTAQGKLAAGALRCPVLRKEEGKSQGELNYANCHYLYFGSPRPGSPKSPLLMELPFLHKNYFAVFYADGSCEKIQLSGHRNVRRAVSVLHVKHSYEEEEFFRLMRLAGEFDKILER